MKSAYRPSVVRPISLRKPGATLTGKAPSATSDSGFSKITFPDPVGEPLSAETLAAHFRRGEVIPATKGSEPDVSPDGSEFKRKLNGKELAAALSAYYGQFIAPEERTPRGKGKPADVPAPVADRASPPVPSANGQ